MNSPWTLHSNFSGSDEPGKKPHQEHRGDLLACSHFRSGKCYSVLERSRTDHAGNLAEAYSKVQTCYLDIVHSSA